ncbi:MAG: sugar isomerase domain-containing protein [Clostridia bacterium]
MLLETFASLVTDRIRTLADEQQTLMEQIADAMADTVAARGSLFVFGCSHSGLLAQDVFYRAGGLMLVNLISSPGMDLATDPPLLTSDMERMPGLAACILDHTPLGAGDLLLVISTSGRNAVPVEMAEQARARGARVVALTSVAYTSAVESHAPSGRRLAEVAHFVLDNGAPVGDAALPVPGLDTAMGPLSSITGTFLLHALMAMTVERLQSRGVDAPVFRSGNLDGGREYNEAMFRRYHDQIHYPHR